MATEQASTGCVESCDIIVDMEPMWSPEAITGYRVWSVRYDRLDGMYRSWRGLQHVAVCGNRLPASQAPHVGERCSCGIYAVKDPSWLAAQFPGLVGLASPWVWLR